MIERAKLGKTISYTDLVARIESIKFKANDSRLFKMLGEISTEEDTQGRGMLTVLVVHKNGDQQPGPGFFELAEQLGRDTADVFTCWIAELNRVYSVWSKPER